MSAFTPEQQSELDNLIGRETERLATLVRQLQAAGDWVAPTLVNSWVNVGGGATPAGYYSDPLGRVFVRGRVKSGTSGTVAFTLPAGYRPAFAEYRPILAQGGLLGYAIVQTNGDVTLNGPNTNDMSFEFSFRNV